MKRGENIDTIKHRVWEIDAWRGFLILAVLSNHLNATVREFCINGYYNIDSFAFIRLSDPLGVWYYIDTDGMIRTAKWVTWLRKNLNYLAVDTFFIISGISCMFSRNNLKRALTTLGAGAFVAMFTKLLAIWTGDPTRFIRFGVLLCYAFCQLAYVYIFKNLDSKCLLLSVIPIFVIGYKFRYFGVTPMRLPIFYIFGVPEIDDLSSDYWPLFPMLGWFLIGVVLGRKYYPEKKTLLPSPVLAKFTEPLQWLGRYSGIIYIGHIVVYTAFFCGIGYLFHLL